MKIIVTGAAGFIGSNLVHALNQDGYNDIIAVDNLTKADKFRNLVDCEISDYWDKTQYLDYLEKQAFGKVDVIFHEGACSDTMEHDGRYMMDNNYRHTLRLLDICQKQNIRLIYASSAAIYGGSISFVEDRHVENPLNIYGYSKFLMDQIVRQRINQLNTQVVGLRYFNVYGPRESHKGRMASVAFHHFNQFKAEGSVRLFGEYGQYGPGQHERDFISVEDIVKVNLFFFKHPEKSGIFNLGTGRAQPFNDIAVTVVNTLRQADNQLPLTLSEMVAEGLVQYIKFPDALRGKYQTFTQANLNRLRDIGYDGSFLSVQEGVARYCHWLLNGHRS
jgi:ADP-L-glycero-D-manno-heptose 6-epimerase